MSGKMSSTKRFAPWAAVPKKARNGAAAVTQGAHTPIEIRSNPVPLCRRRLGATSTLLAKKA